MKIIEQFRFFSELLAKLKFNGIVRTAADN